MPKNAISGSGKARSEDRNSRSPSGRRRGGKRRRSRSRSRRGKDRSRSRSPRKHAGRPDRRRSRSRRSRSRHGAKRRSRSGKAGRRKDSRSRSRSGGGRRRSPSRKKGSPPKKAKSPSRKRSPSKAAAKKRSPSRRRSPSRTAMAKPDAPAPDEAAKNGSEKPPEAKDSSAPAKKAEAEEPAKPPKKGELVTVTFEAKPFGMSPQKAGVEGYVVAKVADCRPAEEKGVQPGWRLVSVGSENCRELGLDAVQALLKAAELPVSVTFEKPPVDDEPPADAEEEENEAEGEGDGEELDILDVRADQRRSQGSALSNLDDLPVEREPAGLPDPIVSWQDACNKNLLSKPLMEKLQAAGLKRPTLIQRHALPIVGHQSGHYDLIAMAQTGSGKTFAFVIPTVARLVLQGAMPRPFFPGKSPGCPLLLVLSPTRELAMQTFAEIEVIAKGTELQQVCIYGGESLKFQQQRIDKAQIDILCATPGRLIDLVDSNKISLSFVQSVVLDEADQMLEQSLEVMCAEILTGRDMPEPASGRQTLLFSATMPQKIRELCPRILRQQVIANLTVGHYGEDQGGSCASIKQILRWVPDEGQPRIQALIDDLKYYWIKAGKKGRVVIFTNQRLQATALANSLIAAGVACVHLHGKLEQHMREEVFDKFRRGQSDVLVATNVASRGLDFPDISLVVQFNLPANVDIYTHRIGRTGRVGQVGCALGYMGPKDRKLNDKLVEFLELNKQEVPDFLQRRRSPPRHMGGRSRSRRRR